MTCVAICELWWGSGTHVEATQTKSEQAQARSSNLLLRRKTSMCTTLLSLYFLGAGIAFLVCTRTFVAFHIFSGPDSSSQAPDQVQLPGGDTESEAPEDHLPSLPRHVRSIAESSDEPAFMQPPVIRTASKADALQARLKRMTSWERRRWLAEHWSSFQILKEDAVSRQFQERMHQFFCSSGDLGDRADDTPVESTRTTDHESDERNLCSSSGSSTSPGTGPGKLCRQRFVLTWMSPVSSFGPRERLCLESIFKWHPHACVVLLSRSLDSSPGRKILEPFVARGYRVTAVTPGLEALFAGTPAATWWQRLRDGTADPGCINLMQNLSNLMRLAALWRYGGVYLDTDVLVLKPLDSVRNAVGTQSQDVGTGRWTRLNNAVLVFDREHPVVMAFLREFVDTFDGSRWGWNGPYLVSRVVERAQHESGNSSRPVSVLPLQAFYPVNWIDIVRFFRRPTDERQSSWQAKELEWMQQGSYAIHLWNKKSNFLKVEEGSIMETLFKQSCLFCKLAAAS